VRAQNEVVEVPYSAAGERLDRFLAQARAIPLASARALIEAGRVRIRGKACSIQRKLFGGEEIHVERPPIRAPPSAPAPSRAELLPVLYDDPDCLVVNKPAGLPVEPAAPGAPSVVGAASRLGAFDVDGAARPGLPHRLDKDTTGCLILARHDLALAALKGAFAAGEVVKTYVALVAGDPPDQGRLDTPYGRDPVHPRRFTTTVASARRARLSFEVRERLPGAALLEVRLETGRTHQIRVQLAEAGWPVLGDAVYGKPSPAISRQALHAERLAFPVPAGGSIAVEAPLPADLLGALERLRAGSS
jgi:23S rRNA pseudouridine1911/1915/1917 synthase